MRESEAEYQATVVLESNEVARAIIGERGRNLKAMERALQVKVSSRGEKLFISGSRIDVELAKQLIEELSEVAKRGFYINPQDVEHAVDILQSGAKVRVRDIFLDTVFVAAKHRAITPKSLNQKLYIDAMRRYDVVIAIGPAGTGKTYLAMAMAVAALTSGEADRIILTRPAVEAGEKLGFLPGDMVEKVNPYLRPLYDALHDMMSYDRVQRLIDQEAIEVAPLAFMRGRTLNNAFVILDEAQNTTTEQMKMFLTRLGYNSKAVITGDITQVDLPKDVSSGLIESQEILKDVEGIKFVYFDEKDVVRHPLVQDIILAYERYEKRKKSKEAADK